MSELSSPFDWKVDTKDKTVFRRHIDNDFKTSKLRKVNLIRRIHLILEVEYRLSEVGSSFLWLHGQLHKLSIAVHTPHFGPL